ncbi:hypothetical protein [Roseimicrobium sp. ORNL1]|uniref:hypothetical protein n=1 Tax=Roseimicrobium sp. ORNL1 TaxID=2711231 RepID=UPI0013E1C19B|nr:hypothetical protein [Roseimicrobium sp. ORNL1]QIF00716.1 hypothetical protein G5S37_03995 [Roseimicrobium sp. ORNL1]
MSVELIPSWCRRIFAWFANRSLRRAKAQFHCPTCEATLPARVQAGLLWEEVMPCSECRGYAPISSYLKFKHPRETEETKLAETEELIEQPLHTRIVADSTANGRRWEVPAKGGWNFLLTFSSLWLALTLTLCALSLTHSLDAPKVTAKAFVPLIFPLIGVGLLYAGLRASLARHTLEVDSREVVYTRHFLGFTRRKILQRDVIVSARLTCIYIENNRPVYAIEVKAKRGRMVFGSMLEPQEKAWLCQEIRQALGLSSATNPPPDSKLLSEWRHGKLEMERGSDHTIVRSQSRRVGTIVLVIGGFFVAIAIFMLRGGLSMWMPWEPHAKVFYYFFNGFIVFWCLLVSIALLTGMAMFRFGWIARNTIKMLHADAQSLTVIATSGRRVVKHTWNPAEVQRMSVETSMRMNSNPIYHGELQLPDRIVTFGTGAPKEDIRRAINLLGDAMGRVEPART